MYLLQTARVVVVVGGSNGWNHVVVLFQDSWWFHCLSCILYGCIVPSFFSFSVGIGSITWKAAKNQNSESHFRTI